MRRMGSNLRKKPLAEYAKWHIWARVRAVIPAPRLSAIERRQPDRREPDGQR
jgi:hypothetical protein